LQRIWSLWWSAAGCIYYTPAADHQAGDRAYAQEWSVVVVVVGHFGRPSRPDDTTKLVIMVVMSVILRRPGRPDDHDSEARVPHQRKDPPGPGSNQKGVCLRDDQRGRPGQGLLPARLAWERQNGLVPGHGALRPRRRGAVAGHHRKPQADWHGARQGRQAEAGECHPSHQSLPRWPRRGFRGPSHLPATEHTKSCGSPRRRTRPAFQPWSRSSRSSPPIPPTIWSLADKPPFDPVVPLTIWKKVQAKLEADPPDRHSPKSPDLWLADLVYCSHCKKPMRGHGPWHPLRIPLLHLRQGGQGVRVPAERRERRSH